MTYFSPKQRAKGCLHSRWGEAVGAFFAVLCVSIILSVAESVARLFANVSVISTDIYSLVRIQEYLRFFPDSLKFLNIPSTIITAVFFVLGIFLTVPLIQGVTRYFWRAAGDSPSGFGVIFDYFSTPELYFRAIKLRLAIYARVFFWAVTLNIPTALLLLPGNEKFAGFLGYTISYDTEILLKTLSGTWLMAAVIILIFILTRYFLAAYFVAEDDEIEISTAIEYSIAWMKGVKWRLIGILLAFAGWILSCVLILPVIYVYPYISQTLACFAREIVKERGEEQKAYDKYINEAGAEE